MVYILAILVFIGIFIFGYVCGFSMGSYHGYDKALEDVENVEELAIRAENAIKALSAIREENDNE